MSNSDYLTKRKWEYTSLRLAFCLLIDCLFLKKCLSTIKSHLICYVSGEEATEDNELEPLNPKNDVFEADEAADALLLSLEKELLVLS